MQSGSANAGTQAFACEAYAQTALAIAADHDLA